MNSVRVFTRGRSHLHRLAIFLENQGLLSCLVVLWPRFKFKGVRKVKSLFLLDYLNSVLNNSLLRLFSDYFIREGQIHILDVNLLRYIREESFKNLYVDMPTTFWAEQDKRWEREEKRTGIEIARRVRAQENLKDSDRYFGYAKGIIVPTDNCRASVPLVYRSKVLVLPFCGYGFDESIQIEIPKKIKKIVCIGIVCPSKGNHLLIDYLGELKGDFRIDFYGRANVEFVDYLRSISSETIELNFHGHVSEAVLYKRILEADICIHSSVSEGLPLSLLQVLKCGKLVFCSNASNLSGIIPDVLIYDTYSKSDFINKFVNIKNLEDFMLDTKILNNQRIEAQWKELVES